MSTFSFTVMVTVFILTFNFANSETYGYDEYYRELKRQAAKCLKRTEETIDIFGCNKCSCIGKKTLMCTVKKCIDVSDVVIPQPDGENIYDDEPQENQVLVSKKKAAVNQKYSKLAKKARKCKKPGKQVVAKKFCAICSCIDEGIIRCKRMPDCVPKYNVTLPGIED